MSAKISSPFPFSAESKSLADFSDEDLVSLTAESPYLSRLAQQEPDIVDTARRTGAVPAVKNVLRDAARRLDKINDAETLAKEMRGLKRRTALLVALGDLTGEATLNDVTAALSFLADVCVRCAFRFLMWQAAEKGEIAVINNAFPDIGSGFFVLAMGKLGAKELNYSSDIDLIVLYDAETIPYTGKRDVASFAVKTTRALISLLEEQTVDGYVFRTDLRLRPDPGSTPVAIATQTAASYYESYAQNWERAAFIKARVIAGDKTAARAFLREIRPFIWRRSSDFYALSQLHAMRPHSGALITDDTVLFGHNIKLAQGGIREIEFFTQMQQLLWGGRDATLRPRDTIGALDALTRAGWVDEDTKNRLQGAYAFLRALEHRLQMRNDEQTQTLPETPEEMGKVARFCGFEGTDAFFNALRPVLKTAQTAYNGLFQNETEGETGGFVFSGAELSEDTAKNLIRLGFTKTGWIADVVRGWLSGRYRSVRSEKARLIIASLFPMLFNALAKADDPDTAFARFDDFLKGLPSGVQLFSLFQSRPALIDLIAEIAGKSPLLSSVLTTRPELFDTVLSPSFLQPFDKNAVAAELTEVLKNEDDLESVLNALRRFAREKKFQISLRFLRELIDIDAVNDDLTGLADCVLNALIPFVMRDFEKKYGNIAGGKCAFLLMGKGGSREMTVLSDLDILFIYDGNGDSAGGVSSLPAMVYYARLAQKIINALSANTSEGVLFDIDMRLRPSGSAGPVATSFASFARYYQNDAWVWELQALTKARVVWAQNGFDETVSGCVRDILRRPRDKAVLTKEIGAMRDKIRASFPAKSAWDVKNADGGMIDIEFFAQYLQLLHAAAHPDILGRSVTNVLTAAARNALITKETAAGFIERYRMLRTVFAIKTLYGDDFKIKAASLYGYGDTSAFERDRLTASAVFVPTP